jgi:large subunit ribosomal protein L19e
MKLDKKKELASKTLGVGKNRIVFNTEHLGDIKEAITKQDIKTLKDQGIIEIKPVKGRKKVERRKTRRGPGKIKKTVNKRKQEYVKITRKLRTYIMNLRDREDLNQEIYKELRKKIRMRNFRSKAHLKEHLKALEKQGIEIKVSEEEKRTKPINNPKKTESKKTTKENKK